MARPRSSWSDGEAQQRRSVDGNVSECSHRNANGPVDKSVDNFGRHTTSCVKPHLSATRHNILWLHIMLH